MTVARAGVAPGSTQACHTTFISAKVAMSVSQMVADSKWPLSVFASLSSASIPREDFPRLNEGHYGQRAGGNLSRQIHRLVVDHRLRQARAGLDALDRHGRSLE